ncbi:MAG: HpcH/HpaI aldolase/citrate lyase family protein [Campylobacterota bacterium]|nr:HpcH/HpaI aldolase/citrate lyase family protein [Campylobacterota bacterium]
MYREFDHIELGATIYTPSISKNVLSIANGEKFPFLKSVIFCLEDAIKESDLPYAMENIQNMLHNYKRAHIKVFIRARDIENLKEILSLNGIEKIDGFVLAKISFKNMQNYFDILNTAITKYHIMPVLESKDIFQNTALKYIRDYLINHKNHNILTMRFGAEDMFSYLSLKKSCEDSIHDFHIAVKVFGDILSVFKPYGFNITAPVYNCLENKEFFKKEVKRDIKEGFFGKTIIHPDQAKITNEVYAVTQKELDEAKAILDIQNEAIFRFEDKMCEPSAHHTWAKNIIRRYDVFGLKDQL